MPLSNLSVPSAFFFPLRTNVGYFDSPAGYLSLAERVKQASLLYETIVFESGLYTSNICENGNTDLWLPPEDLTAEMLAEKRDSHQPTGGDFYFGLRDPNNGELQPLVSGPVVRRFHCEFHSTLRHLNVGNLPWIRMGSLDLTEHGNKSADRLEPLIEAAIRSDFSKAEHFLKSKIVSSLSHDLTLGNA